MHPAIYAELTLFARRLHNFLSRVAFRERYSRDARCELDGHIILPSSSLCYTWPRRHHLADATDQPGINVRHIPADSSFHMKPPTYFTAE